MAKIVSTVRVRLSRQCGRRIPKTSYSRVQSSREFAGRFAGVGQSAVAMGVTSGTVAPWRAASSNVATARPSHVVCA